jgi:hypothetical protein
MVILQVGFCYALHVGAVVGAAVAAAVAVPLGGWHHAWDPSTRVPWYHNATMVLLVRTMAHVYVPRTCTLSQKRTMVPWYLVPGIAIHVYVRTYTCPYHGSGPCGTIGTPCTGTYHGTRVRTAVGPSYAIHCDVRTRVRTYHGSGPCTVHRYTYVRVRTRVLTEYRGRSGRHS